MQLFPDSISPCGVVFGFCFSWQGDGGGGAFGDGECPDPFVAFITPGAFDDASCRTVFGFDMA